MRSKNENEMDSKQKRIFKEAANWRRLLNKADASSLREKNKLSGKALMQI